MRARCRHCQAEKRIMSKGLCSRCYTDPAIHPLYPRLAIGRKKDSRNTGDLSRFACTGLGLTQGRVPAEPTTALPGTKAKALVMRQRVENNEMPNHPLDARHGPTTCYPASESADRLHTQ